MAYYNPLRIGGIDLKQLVEKSHVEALALRLRQMNCQCEICGGTIRHINDLNYTVQWNETLISRVEVRHKSCNQNCLRLYPGGISDKHRDPRVQARYWVLQGGFSKRAPRPRATA